MKEMLDAIESKNTIEGFIFLCLVVLKDLRTVLVLIIKNTSNL